VEGSEGRRAEGGERRVKGREGFVEREMREGEKERQGEGEMG
jgi:hypothetical protein